MSAVNGGTTSKRRGSSPHPIGSPSKVAKTGTSDAAGVTRPGATDDDAEWFIKMAKEKGNPIATESNRYKKGELSMQYLDIILSIVKSDKYKEVKEMSDRCVKISEDENVKNKIIELYNAVPKDVNIAKVLDSLSEQRKTTLQYLTVANATDSSKKCFFIQGKSGACFRHNGILGYGKKFKPPAVYLKKSLIEIVKTMGYFTASGSGKTVEGAGIAYIRGRDLGIYLSPKKDVHPEKDKAFDDTKVRDAKSMKMMGELLEEVCEFNKSFITALQSSIGDKKLTVGISVDEASVCPNFVRSITQHAENGMAQHIKDVMKAQTGLNIPADEIAFSVLGTGASGGSVGSKPDSWEDMECTSASTNPKKVYNSLVNYTEGLAIDFPSYEELQRFAPILFTLVKHNARLCSIIIDHISKLKKAFSKLTSQQCLERFESVLSTNALEVFIKSNGLSKIAKEPKIAPVVGAQALAVRLFGKKAEIPNSLKERLNIHTSFDYGITKQFEGYKEKEPATVPMVRLISTYGLVTPAPLPAASDAEGENPSEVLDTPFVIDDAMVIVALYLLGLPDGADVLGSGYEAFEITSAQIVKGALSASATLKDEFRPSVSDVLAKVGFKSSKQPVGAKTALHDSALMEVFKSVKVVRHKNEEKTSDTDSFNYQRTHLQRCPMRLSDGHSAINKCIVNPESGKKIDASEAYEAANKVWKAHSDVAAAEKALEESSNLYNTSKSVPKSKLDKALKNQEGELSRCSSDFKKCVEEIQDKVGKETDITLTDEKNGGCLIIDEELLDMLLRLEAMELTESERLGSLFPFTTISCGNSPLADAYVTFFGRCSESKQVKRYTIMIQAKDYSPDSHLDFKHIGENVQRCRSPLLDVAFGVDRLMCVASRDKQLMTPAKSVERKFLSYSVDESKILGTMMGSLYEKISTDKAKGIGANLCGRPLFGR